MNADFNHPELCTRSSFEAAALAAAGGLADRSTNRNRAGLQPNLPDHIDIPIESLHAMRLNSTHRQGVAQRCAGQLAVVAGHRPLIDIIHLGLGGDGQSAPLIPEDPMLDEVSKNPAVSPVLSIDVGGSHVKVMDSARRERRQFESGRGLSAGQMCRDVLQLTADWDYATVSIGIPAPVRNNRPVSNPPNLGAGWADFDYAAAFGKPLKIINDAAMQALGSYQGGKTLFLGLGTGLGTALITENLIVPMELAHLPYRKNRTYEDYIGEAGLQRLGKTRWCKHVARVVALLQSALLPEKVILGGGNVRHFDALPPDCLRGNNDDAFLGGFRLWENHFTVI